MKNFPGENGNLSNSSIYKARIREQDIAANQKLQEIQGAADELARQAIIDKLRQAEVEHEKLKLKLEQEAYDGINNILSHVELSAAENKDNVINGIDGLLAKLFKFFNFMDSELGVETDPQVYSMIKEREKKQVWIAAFIKFLRDKFNKLVKATFSRDLSFQQKIDKEIKELHEKLFSGSLSPEEEAAMLERLEALRDLKLKLQIFVVGSVIAMFAELFSVELTASVETTKEEGRNTEKTSAKEATKEVRENLEIKVDAKEKPQLKYDVIPALDAESWLKKPITLSKPELDLLPNALKDILLPVPNYNMNKGNSEGLKPEVKGKQENEDKKAKPELKKKVHPPKPVEQKHEARGLRFYLVDEGKSYGAEDRNLSSTISDVSGKKYKPASKQKGRFASSRESCLSGDASSVDKKGTNSTDKKEVLCAKLAEKVVARNARKNCAEASAKHDYPIDHFQASAETNGKSHTNNKSKPKQGSVNNAQPKSECSSVKINNHVESIGKAPEEASRGI